mmetsp:Transcript_78534/g.222038  ORF Transcript_78534/g.222038 Transcript_78534/m.222038 type:complete len:204 (+) Transcript_78534:427-1038(+)
MRAAVLIVSPKSLKRGSLWPMTPATTGPVCMPILKMAPRGWDCSCLISAAASTSRCRIPEWPWSASSSRSAGTTPTAQTYSSPTVSTFVTRCAAQIRSKRVKYPLRKAMTSRGESLLATWSKSTNMMNRTETRCTCSAVAVPFNMGTMRKDGSTYCRTRKYVSLCSLCLKARTNLFLLHFSVLRFFRTAMRCTRERKTQQTSK